MSTSKSHMTNLERLDELTSRHEYMNEFFDSLMSTIQKPKNIHLTKSNEYITLMRRLTFYQEQRSKVSKRGYELGNRQLINSDELEELHFVRMLDNGLLSSIWIAIREFVRDTDLDINIDEGRV